MELTAGPSKDWLEWYHAYDDPASSLSRRLTVVRNRLAAVLDARGDQPTRLLSLCAGDGRDVIPMLAGPPRHGRVDALLVERDRRLVDRAVSAADEASLDRLCVRHADAGDPGSFLDVLPADVLMLCGIFGNVKHQSVRDIIQDIKTCLAPASVVIWTRGASSPDRRPEARQWFADDGFTELSFDQETDGFGVGVHLLVFPDDDNPAPRAGRRLFTFVA